MSLAELVAGEYAWMLSQSMKLCHNRMDAEDLAGDAVLKILCSPKKYDFSRPFRPWASVIILNTYITRYNHDSLITYADTEQCVPAVAPDDTSVRVSMSEVCSAVRRCRSRSSTVGCLVMYACGYSYEEISDYYGIPSGTVRSRISYARNMLRKELGYQYVK